jgi:hypothetical protein
VTPGFELDWNKIGTPEPLTFEADPRNPRCKRCGQRMAQGTYAAIELGELLVWAEHIDECEKRNSP